MAVSAEDLAYAAGILDGEGCISIALQKQKSRKSYYRMSVRVSNTNKEVMEWLWLTFGGSMGVGHRERRHVLYYWIIASRQGGDFLKLVLPYLRIKHSRAKLAISFQERRHPMTGSKGNKTDEEWIIDEASKVLMSKYNQLEVK